MPHIDVSLYPGRTPELKQELADKIFDFFSNELGFKPESLSVSFSEYPAEEFNGKVKQKIKPEDMLISSIHVK